MAKTAEYIKTVLCNPIASKNVTNKIVKKISILKEQPMCGISLAEKTVNKTDLRVLICDNHLAFYRVQGNYISVVRIIDGRTDYLTVLFNE